RSGSQRDATRRRCAVGARAGRRSGDRARAHWPWARTWREPGVARVSDAATAFLEATVRTATPLALAAFGEVVVERAGVINISLEGVILSGAFGALVGATHGGTAGGYVASMVAGLAVAIVFGLFAVRLRADQIITGTAVTLLVMGLTGTLYRTLYGATGAALSIPTSGPRAIPGLHSIPVIGSAF